MWTELILRIVHLSSAIVLVGSLYTMIIINDGLLSEESDEKWQIRRGRWSRSIMIASGLLLITGLINAFRLTTSYQFPETNYHAWLGVKILLGLVVMFGASVLSGRSLQAQQCRGSPWCARFILIVAVLTVVVAAYLKESPRTRKSPAPPALSVPNTAEPVSHG